MALLRQAAPQILRLRFAEDFLARRRIESAVASLCSEKLTIAAVHIPNAVSIKAKSTFLRQADAQAVAGDFAHSPNYECEQQKWPRFGQCLSGRINPSEMT